MSPLHCPKEPFHFTSLYFFHLSYQLFASLYFGNFIYNSLLFTSLFIAFTSAYFFSISYPSFSKICFLPWEVPVAPSSSWFQSAINLFTKEYFPKYWAVIGI
jgi:hypothetical protein